ncbi:MAG: LD-carboxypeptidase [Bacteroidota bacterium]
MISPVFLKKGDKIAIVASARKISKEELESSFKIIRGYGLDVVYSENLFDVDNQFAGSDDVRAAELQKMLDDEAVKAVFFARGGYGSVRIIDKIDFSNFVSNPKWLVGYSDITVFHNHVVTNFGIQTLHASMPINFKDNTKQVLDSLFDVLFGKYPSYEIETHSLNRNGIAYAELVGGNLSVLYSLLGSISFPETDGKILFLEDLDEYLYHIDRVMIGLKRAGKLSNLAGLIVGGMTQMNDNIIPFGKTAEEIILDTVCEFDYPVYFNFPAGHIDDNRALVMGRRVKIEVKKGSLLSSISFS